MYSVSYVVDITGASSETINTFYDLAESAQKDYGIVLEYLLYTTRQAVDTHLPSKYVQIISNKNITHARNIAVASASSVWLMFTSSDNAASDTLHEMSRAVITQHTRHFLIPVRHVKLHRTAPFFIVRNLKFFAISKDFYIEAKSLGSESIEQLISFAIQKKYLHYIAVARNSFKKVYRVSTIKLNRVPKLPEKSSLKPQSVKKIAYSTNIPVFIICRDRFTPLLSLVKWLEAESMTNIIFINNASTYPPMLKFFKETKYTVINLKLINAGHTVAWTEGIIDMFAYDKPYILTDPDVIPSEDAHGAVRYFVETLNTHKQYIKVGFGLRIDNLPDHYEQKNNVIRWEEKFWKNEVDKDLYDADIDTTFALYRPNAPYVLGPSLRTGDKYLAEHEPWYIDSNNIPADLKYYRKHADKTIGTWGINKKDVSETYK